MTWATGKIRSQGLRTYCKHGILPCTDRRRVLALAPDFRSLNIAYVMSTSRTFWTISMRIRTLRSPKAEVAIRDCINWFEAHKYQRKQRVLLRTDLSSPRRSGILLLLRSLALLPSNILSFIVVSTECLVYTAYTKDAALATATIQRILHDYGTADMGISWFRLNTRWHFGQFEDSERSQSYCVSRTGIPTSFKTTK
jgi:hypothetical protein